MNLEKISNREQILIFVAVFTIVVGAYTFFRAMPKLRALTVLQTALEQNQEKVKNPILPEEVLDEPDELQEKLDDLESELASKQVSLVNAEQGLASTDNQDMLLKISEAARVTNVRVTENVPYLVPTKDGTSTQTNKQKLSKRQQRRSDREARKLARKNGNANIQGTAAAGAAPKEGELIYKLVNEIEPPRPLQRISIEGNFGDLQKFIQAINNLPLLASIVRLDINTSIVTPPQGMPQPISATMIIAI